MTTADEPFLRRVYASTRTEELAPVPWTDEQKGAFLDQQFDAQDHHYRTYYPGLELLVVELDDEAIGRLYRCILGGELRVLDIALLPPWRNRGHGSRLLDGILAEAAAAGIPVTLYVEAHNPARRLYDRLGFVLMEEGDVYDLLEWRPPPSAAAG